MRWIALFCTLALFANDIVVELATESQLKPYTLHWEGDPQLKEVMAFDLNHCGYLTPHGRAAYQIRAQIEEKSLLVTIGGANKTIRAPLTDDFARNRKIVHEVSDAIIKTLFNKEGIASKRLIYTVKKSDRNSEVWTSDYDGGNARQLTRDGEFCVTPCFLQGAKGANGFFYVSYRTGQPKIYMSPLAPGGSQRFSTLRGNQLMPTISPKRDCVAFISDAGGNPDLFIQWFNPATGAVGKPQQLFSAPGAAQASPTFSPDGSKIAFVSNKNGHPRIYLIDVPKPGQRIDNPNPRLITRVCRENTAPSWSPDGTKIAYSAMTDGVRQIWIYNLLTDEESQLTTGPQHKENPYWAQDSFHLVYNSDDLYLVNLNQPASVRITSGPGEKRFPCWERA